MHTCVIAKEKSLAIYAGYVIDSIEVNGEVYGASDRGNRIDVPMEEGEVVLRLEYGINSDWEGQETDLKIRKFLYLSPQQ